MVLLFLSFAAFFPLPVQAEHAAPPQLIASRLSTRERIVLGVNDFMSFYAAGRLCGSRDLYNPAATFKQEMMATGYFEPNTPMVRLPYFALIMSPLARLPYRTAYGIFQALSILSVIAVVLMQATLTGRIRAILAILMSYPLLLAICLAQDITFVMLLLVLVMRFWNSKPSLAGVALAICTVKYHLLLFMPLVLLLHWRPRLAKSFAITLISLTVASFAVAGVGWPVHYVNQLRSPWDVPIHMPNIRALVLGTAHPVLYGIVLSGMVAITVIVGLIRCRGNFPLCVSIALSGSILVSPHVFVQDCAILIPSLLALWSYGTTTVISVPLWTLLVPVPYFLRTLDDGFTCLIQVCLFSFIAAPTFARSGSESNRNVETVSMNGSHRDGDEK